MNNFEIKILLYGESGRRPDTTAHVVFTVVTILSANLSPRL